MVEVVSILEIVASEFVEGFMGRFPDSGLRFDFYEGVSGGVNEVVVESDVIKGYFPQSRVFVEGDGVGVKVLCMAGGLVGADQEFCFDLGDPDSVEGLFGLLEVECLKLRVSGG